MNANVGKYLIKGVGAVGLGLVLYDAHTLGKIESASYSKNRAAINSVGPYTNTLSQDNGSIIQSRVKKRASNFMMDENITRFFNGAIGYFKGVGTMLVDHVVPLGLALGTLLTKGKTSKVFGFGLLAYGGYFFLNQVLGLFKPNELTKKF